MRVITDLNFGWQYKNDFKEEYITDKNQFQGFISVDIPHTNIELPYNYFNEELYAFESCYRKTINIPAEYKGKDIFLCFDGAGQYAKVYLNGLLITEHKGGYTGFEINIEKTAHYGEDNVLVVYLDSREREEIPPFGNVVDYLTYGGIYREVYLRVVEKTHIQNLFVKTDDIFENTKTVELDVLLSRLEEDLSIDVSIKDQKEKHISVFSFDTVAKNRFTISKPVNNIQLWDIDNPALYTVTLTLKRNGIAIDTITETFGFRHTEFKTDGFYLNGKKLKIRGLNRHQSFAYTGYAMPASLQIEDARILKEELGVNLVRTSHYPQSQHFINACDRLGLLVFTEIPGWQFISGNTEWRSLVLQNVEEMILQNRNHPSIILWGVRINESKDDDDLYIKTNELAKKLDPTRQTGGVRCIAGSHLIEDVYTYNDFNHRGDNDALADVKKVTQSETAPYLVTEHNGHMFPTKRFDHEEKRLEHALRHMRVLDSMYGNKRTSGAIGWCMFDYNTHKDFGSGDKICYHGVMDMFRIPKLAAYTYSSQQDKTPVMEVASSMDIGEHPVGEIGPLYIFTNCDFVRFYKNDKLIGDFYPDKTNFPNVPHAPILITDLVGPYLQENEGIKEKHANTIKEILNYIAVNGAALPLKYQLKMGWAMLCTGLKLSDGYRLFSMYVGNWGTKKTVFRYEGYTGGTLIKTVIKSGVNKPHLKVSADRYALIEDKTWDAVRVVLQMECENNNVLPYSNEGIHITCEGALSLIGSNTISLIGGATGFYLRTHGESGSAKVTVKSQSCGEYSLNFTVEKKSAGGI